MEIRSRARIGEFSEYFPGLMVLRMRNKISGRNGPKNELYHIGVWVVKYLGFFIDLLNRNSE